MASGVVSGAEAAGGDGAVAEGELIAGMGVADGKADCDVAARCGIAGEREGAICVGRTPTGEFKLRVVWLALRGDCPLGSKGGAGAGAAAIIRG